MISSWFLECSGITVGDCARLNSQTSTWRLHYNHREKWSEYKLKGFIRYTAVYFALFVLNMLMLRKSVSEYSVCKLWAIEGFLLNFYVSVIDGALCTVLLVFVNRSAQDLGLSLLPILMTLFRPAVCHWFWWIRLWPQAGESASPTIMLLSRSLSAQSNFVFP